MPRTDPAVCHLVSPVSLIDNDGMFVFLLGLGSSTHQSKLWIPGASQKNHPGPLNSFPVPTASPELQTLTSLASRMKVPTECRWLRIHDVFHLRTFWRKRSCQQLEGPFTKKVEFEGQRGPLVTQWQAGIATKVIVCIKLEVHPGGQRGRCMKPWPTQMYKASVTQEIKHLYETKGAIYRLVNTRAGTLKEEVRVHTSWWMTLSPPRTRTWMENVGLSGPLSSS